MSGQHRRGENRSVQFAAYRALKGYEEMVAERTREKEERIRLSEEAEEALSRRLSTLHRGDPVEVRYYDRDVYRELRGILTELDPVWQTLSIDRKKIPFGDLLNVRKMPESERKKASSR
ncbi:MAG: YolD-like family protein [Clostridia bacterium]|nr:YolD-like family protein [Clostridia bacterium]